jgi:thiol-disulfide isomerase/thioredoxin
VNKPELRGLSLKIAAMALTESNMLPLGTVAPDFTLPDTVSGKDVDLFAAAGEGVFVVMFICNHCPYVVHVNPELVRLARDYEPKGVRFFAISSNDIEKYPADAPDKMREHALSEGYSFPYLYDADQEVARAYDAACTPDFYVFDKGRRLVYRGRLDGSRPGNDIPLSGADLRTAIDAALAGEPPIDKQYPSAGCNIKWRPS